MITYKKYINISGKLYDLDLGGLFLDGTTLTPTFIYDKDTLRSILSFKGAKRVDSSSSGSSVAAVDDKVVVFSLGGCLRNELCYLLYDVELNGNVLILSKTSYESLRLVG